MKREQHIKAHQRWHETLDRIVAHYFATTRKLPTQSTIMDLLEWSRDEAIEPTPDPMEEEE